ncbi:MAG: hypothetical protein LBT79_05220 [Elusimicrobiota bacterium]|nr:hypothetical protein [Elusimicrobiota bacterium]
MSWLRAMGESARQIRAPVPMFLPKDFTSFYKNTADLQCNCKSAVKYKIFIYINENLFGRILIFALF